MLYTLFEELHDNQISPLSASYLVYFETTYTLVVSAPVYLDVNFRPLSVYSMA